MTELRSFRWWELRWPEISALDRDNTLIIQPTGAIEQHGHHLPLDTDIHDSSELAYRVAEKANTAGMGNVLIMPPVWWGTSPHHLAYPGTISLSMKTMSDLLVEIASSLWRHGFYRLMFLNGHGGNAGVLSGTALRISEQVGISPAVCHYWTLIPDVLNEIGESELGGMGHACEFETSLQLHLRKEGVDMASAARDMPKKLTSYSHIDFRNAGPVMLPWDFARDSRTGTMGDATLANEAKGKKVADAAVERLVGLARELLLLGKDDLLSGQTRTKAS